MITLATKTHVTAAELKDLLDKGEPFLLLDVRNEEEFERWKIEGRHTPPTLNIPYFAFLEDLDGSAQQVPRNRPVLAVCGKGGSSAWVADEVLRPRGFEVANLEGGMASWAAYYAVHAVSEATGSIRIWQLERPSRGCLHYVIGYSERRGGAVVIDPPRHYEQVLELAQAQGLEITDVIDTHAHADHISGGTALARATGAKYWLHPYDGIHPIDVLPAAIPYEWLHDGQEFHLGSAVLQAIHVPGHTLGMTALFLKEGGHGFLFSGDTIFIRSIARPDLGGRGETWAPLHYRSLYERLLTLPEGTLVLPGHFSSPQEARNDSLFAEKLGDLRRANPELTMSNQEAFIRHILASLPVFPPQYVDIKRVNAGLLQPDEEKANELELGKNVCALAKAHENPVWRAPP
jgi:glyoxylase-like metal-dependent hydrolase (beta-lactamase superfamily II)/rhodanese-related sulfurtransferase